MEDKLLRVFICGAQSTGKTTLLHDVGAQCGGDFHCESEVARNLIKSLGINPRSISPTKRPAEFETLQYEIVAAQCQVERRNAILGRNYIADRGIDPVVYTHIHLGLEAKKQMLNNPLVQECIERYKQSLIFVLTPHKECLVDDGFRLMASLDELQHFTNVMQLTLDELKIPYITIEQLDREKRVQIVMEHIDRKLTRNQPNGIN